MTDKQIIIDDLMKQLNEKTVAIMLLRETLDRKEQECEELKEEIKTNGFGCFNIEMSEQLDQLKAQLLDQEAETLKAGGIIHKLEKALTEIKEIAKPYQRDIDKICGYCRKYDSCHTCCIDDLKLYEYRTGTTKACERFVELERFNINIVANKILQKISECEE